MGEKSRSEAHAAKKEAGKRREESARNADEGQGKVHLRMEGARERREQGDERHETKGKRCRQP